jgi:predicted dehydrogenase
MGIHAIDTTRFLLDDPKPVSVYAKIGTHYGDYDVDDTGVIIIQWDNGVTSYVESGWWQPHMDGPEASTQIYSTKGFGQVFPTLAKVPNVKAQKIDVLESGFSPSRDPHCAQSMYDAQMAYFVDCVREGRIPSPGIEEGLVNMQIVAATYESSETGKVVSL